MAIKFLSGVLIAIVLSISLTNFALAHQSGCHRWHSCPSDTGSYVCGDTGYDTYCGGESYTQTPDYESQGTENGNIQVTSDKNNISNTAQSDGTTMGYKDGYANTYSSSVVDKPEFCEREFTFNGYAPNEYQSAFYQAYRESCTDLYNDTYAGVYNASYEEGQKAYQTTLANSKSEDASTSQTNNSGWIWLGVLGFGYVCYLISEAKGSKK